MKSYNCEVERMDKYIVEFDESVCNEEWLEEFAKFFYDFYDLEDHARHIAQYRARFGRGFIEGYGIPLENGKEPYWVFTDEQRKQINHAINIKIISEDDDIYVDTRELENF